MIKFIFQNSFQLEQQGQKLQLSSSTFITSSSWHHSCLALQRTQIGRQTGKQAATR